MEPLARGDGRQRLGVGALDLPRSLPDLPLADDGAGVWTEGHAAAPPSLKVHHGHAQVVRVRNHLDLKVDASSGRLAAEHVGSQAAPEISDLVGVGNRADLRAAKRGAEGRHVRVEVVVAPLPIDPRQLPAAARAAGEATAAGRRRRGPLGAQRSAAAALGTRGAALRKRLIERGSLEGALPLEFHAMERPDAQSAPRADAAVVQLPQEAAGGVRGA
mmetsp:Transcript_128624/g.251918  ORF Transcript_128624/g.251918 Transcript_128624/m.251918 type:complete len:217 (+) Transcript_128624:333-983(+)